MPNELPVSAFFPKWWLGALVLVITYVSWVSEPQDSQLRKKRQWLLSYITICYCNQVNNHLSSFSLLVPEAIYAACNPRRLWVSHHLPWCGVPEPWNPAGSWGMHECHSLPLFPVDAAYEDLDSVSTLLPEGNFLKQFFCCYIPSDSLCTVLTRPLTSVLFICANLSAEADLE